MLSLPKDQGSSALSVPLPDPTVHGIRLTQGSRGSSRRRPGDLRAVQRRSHSRRKDRHLRKHDGGENGSGRVLAGLEMPTGGVIR